MTSDQLDATFAALADPTRRAILARLAGGDATVNELAEPFDMSQPAISRHLKVLEKAGLISMGKDAQRRPRKLEAKPLGDAYDWLEKYREFWSFSYQRLDFLLDQLQHSQAAPTTSTEVTPQSRRPATKRSAPGHKSSDSSAAQTTNKRNRKKS